MIALLLAMASGALAAQGGHESNLWFLAVSILIGLLAVAALAVGI